jgi:HPr kinase/phosphorylase
MDQIHATCICINATAVLLLGPSGCGKSDLALRLIDEGATLIADDRVNLRRKDDALIASAAKNIFGLLEVRGIGILHFDAAQDKPVALVAHLDPEGDIERLPEPSSWNYLGVSIPAIHISPFEASAPSKIRLALGIALKDILVVT